MYKQVKLTGRLHCVHPACTKQQQQDLTNPVLSFTSWLEDTAGDPFKSVFHILKLNLLSFIKTLVQIQIP